VTYFESIFFGIIQGLAEFLPISSSGHLVLLQSYFGLNEPMVLFDVFLHVGTLLAVLVVYRSDISAMLSQFVKIVLSGGKKMADYPMGRTATMIIVANIPTAIIGLTLKDYFELLFASPIAVGFMLLITGAILFATKGNDNSGKEDSEISIKDALMIGVAQGFAITPGISRSGMTIAVALMLGVKRESAARFSFILSMPAILGAAILKARHASIDSGELTVILLGSAVAFVVGIAALVWLINIVKRGKLVWFSYYCWLVGIVVIMVNI